MKLSYCLHNRFGYARGAGPAEGDAVVEGFQPPGNPADEKGALGLEACKITPSVASKTSIWSEGLFGYFSLLCSWDT